MDNNSINTVRSKINITIVYEDSFVSYDVDDSVPFNLKNLSNFEDCPINFCCSNSHCGSCLIKIIEGKEFIDPPTEHELELLASLGANDNERLACGCLVRGNIKIEPLMV